MIVFGWNNFRIKTFNHYELGLTENAQTDFTIEVRQSYFHLFWIPFFGLGKKWVIRKHSQLYELPAVYVEVIQSQNIKVKTPWYTFTGPILIILGFLGFSAQEKYSNYQSHIRAKNQYEEKTKQLANQLDHLNTKDIVKIKDCKSDYGSNFIYLKAEKINGKTIVFKKFSTGMEQYYEKPMDVERYFVDHYTDLDTVEINKAVLLNSFSKDYETYTSMNKTGSNLLKDEKKYEITEVNRHFGPIIKDNGSGGFLNNSLSIGFLNLGWTADIIKIKNIEGNIKWTTELPKRIESVSSYNYPSFNITGEGYNSGAKYKFSLVVKDSLNYKHEYIVEGENMNKTVTRID